MMLAKRILLSVSLLYLITGGRSQLIIAKPAPLPEPEIRDEKVSNCTHIMLTPVLMKSEQQGCLCMILDKCEETLQVTAGLEFSGNKTPIFNESVFNSSYIKCKKFQVPKADNPEQVFVSLHITGPTTDRQERKIVVIDNMPKVYIANFDKPMYKPGDKVQCRLVCLHHNLTSCDMEVQKVYLVDNNGARIAMISNPESHQGVVPASFSLSMDASPGSYQLVFEMTDGLPHIEYFSVDNYMLPRFDSAVSCPSSISILDRTATVTVSAQYVYGKPVPATVIMRCCRRPAYTYGRASNCFKGLEEICMDLTGEMDSNGSYHNIMDLKHFNMQFSGFDNSINCEITVKENGTGVLDTKSCYIGITSQPAQLQFNYRAFKPHFKRGIDLPCCATLTDQNGSPMANKTIRIEVNDIYIRDEITDADGKVNCSIDTRSYYKQNMSVRVSYQADDQCYTADWTGRDFPSAEYLFYRFSSSSDSYLQIRNFEEQLSCHQSHIAVVDYIFSKEGAREGTINVYYTIMADDCIVAYGQQEVDLREERKGTFQINFTVTAEYPPSAQLLVIAPVSGELISDTVAMDIEPCFNNSVSLSRADEVVAPGSEAEFIVTAAPGSFCALKSTDDRFTSLGYYNPFSPDNIHNMRRYYHNGYIVKDNDLEEPKPPCVDPNTEVYCHNQYFRVTSSPTDGDTYGNLRDLSLVAGTNRRTRKFEVCGMEEQISPIPLRRLVLNDAAAVSSKVSGSAGSIVTIRSNFDTSFGWDTVTTDSNGSATVTLKFPDSITKWNTEMFCTSGEVGFGMLSQSLSTTTSLDFFTNVEVPDFVTAEEDVVITAETFNFLRYCAEIRSSTVPSTDFTVEDPVPDVDICLCERQADIFESTLIFENFGPTNVTFITETTSISDTCGGPNDPSQPSRKDVVTKKVFVLPPGIESAQTSSNLIAVNDTSSERDISMPTPENMVPGSSTLECTVVGDSMALSVQNMDNMLLLPIGCCEQNVAVLRCMALLMKYLKATKQFSDNAFEEAKNKLSERYAQQMACRQWNGHYSVFWGRPYTNSWLDVNTYTTNCLVEELIYVDDSVQQKSLQNFGELQNLTSGCLSPIGAQFTSQDTEDDVFGFTCYYAVEMMKCKLPSIGQSVLKGAIRCLDNANFDEMRTTTQACLFYLACLTNNTDKCQNMYKTFEEKKISEDGTTHWVLRDAKGLPDSYNTDAVGITTYVLSAIMTFPNKTEQQKTLCAEAVTWTANQMTSQGGLSNSQDTARGLEAMINYNLKRGYVGETNAEVVVSKDGVEVSRINVTEQNKFVVQRQQLPTSDGPYKVAVAGKGEILIQLENKYYVQIPKENPAFSLQVNVTGDCSNGVAKMIDSRICVSYNGNRSQTNMVFLDCKSFTGYTPDDVALSKLVDENMADRAKREDNHVHIYFLTLKQGEEKCISYQSYMGPRVLSFQNSNCVVYNAYKVDESGSAVFSHPCTAKG